MCLLSVVCLMHMGQYKWLHKYIIVRIESVLVQPYKKVYSRLGLHHGPKLLGLPKLGALPKLRIGAPWQLRHGASSQPTASASVKKKQRKFIASHPRPTAPPPSGVLPRRHDLPRQQAPTPSAGMPPRQQAPSPGAGLPPQLPKTVFIPDAPPHAMSFTELPPYNLSPSRPSFGATAAWNVCSSASSPTLGYEDNYFSSTPMPVFDWTPNYSANDPLHSSSQPLMNLLGQDADADLQLLMPPDATPSSGGKGATKRGGNYTHDEDILLCNSWINISNDPVVGADQSGKSYWERIAAQFHKNKTFESDRTTNSLEQRFQTTILRECMRFQGYFEAVERRRPSGVPHNEHLMEAQAMYARKSGGKICPFIHC